MFFRRRNSRSINPVTSKAAAAHRPQRTRDLLRRACVTEPLEARRLLTTLTGGGTNQTNTFEYRDAADQLVRIALRGNITAEFIAVYTPASDAEPPRSTTDFLLINLVPATADEEIPGADLFAIYVAEAEPGSSISIATVPALTTEDRPMQPFTTDVGSFSVINATNGEREDVSPASQSGGVLIGARTDDTIDGTDLEENIAVGPLVLKQNFGVRPKSPKGKIDPGLVVASGQTLSQFLLGGTIIGTVSIGGNMDLFYAGQIWTGDATGLLNGQSATPRNFNVEGDLRNLVTIGSIGTTTLDGNNIEEVTFKSGTDIYVKGRLGQISTKDSFFSGVAVLNEDTRTGTGDPTREVEVRGDRDALADTSLSFFEGINFAFDQRQLAPSVGDNPLFDNDTRENAQMLGTFRSSRLRSDEVAEVVGSLNHDTDVDDNIDWYSIGLLAGQNVQIELTGSSQNVGIFDPDGRLIASDYSTTTDFSLVEGAPFRFTTDRPGVYKIAIGWRGDINFNGTIDGGEAWTFVDTTINYTLDIARVADIGFGGITAVNSIGTDNGGGTSIYVQNGDLGGLLCTTVGQSTIFDTTGSPYTVLKGNLRAMEADSIGQIRDGGLVIPPTLRVPRGSVGLLRGRATDLNANVVYVLTQGSIGFDAQLVEANSIFTGSLVTSRGIGVIRAQQMGHSTLAPVLSVNADRRGDDGFIDLLDVTGSFGTIETGGPQISTGPKGNVRYIHVANPLTSVFPDRFFGGGDTVVRTLNPGASLNFTDDSGTNVRLSATPDPRRTSDNAQIAPGTIRYVSYGIRDKGGSVMIDVDVLAGTEVINDGSGGVSIAIRGRGLLVETGARGTIGSFEMGQVRVIGPGTNYVFNASTRAFTAQGADATVGGDSADVILRGGSPIDVYDVTGITDAAGGTLMGLTSIDNRTSGEIVNVEAQHVGSIRAQTIGIPRSSTGTEIGGLTIRSDDTGTTPAEFPFQGQRTLIDIAGNAPDIQSRGPLGNIIVGDVLGTITANSDGTNDRSIIEGFVRPVLSKGAILEANIGEGLMPSGTGFALRSGIFSNGAIASVRGTNTDIRGPIVSSSGGRFLPATTVGTQNLAAVASTGDIRLTNGSLIGAVVASSPFIDVQQLPHSTSIIGAGGIPTLNSIRLTGNGGIIGTRITGDAIGLIDIRQGFGFINSFVSQTTNSSSSGIETDGYGIRLSTITGGETLDRLNARGTGKVLDTREFSPSVRQSERNQFDPFSGQLLTRLNDLHKFLGTSATKPKNSSTSVAGTIEDSDFSGGRSLNRLDAFRILGRSNGPGMRLAFAQDIIRVNVRDRIDGLNMITARLRSLVATRDVQNSTFSVSGRIEDFYCLNLKASTTIEALGPDGVIDLIRTKKALFGNVTASTGIGRILVGTDFGSLNVSSSNDINLAQINGSMLDRSFLRAADRIDRLVIGGNIDTGATVRARRIGTQQITGDVNGDIITG